MRKIIPVLLAWGLAASVLADNYKILQMNTPFIKIGSKICKKGDVFSSDDSIVWSLEKQAFKAQNLQTKEICLFSEPAFKAKDSKTISEYFLKTNRLSGRIIGLSELTENLENQTFYMLDTIRIESPVPLDSTRSYYIQYDNCEKKEKHNLQSDGNSFIILRSQLISCDSTKDRIISVYFTCKGIEDDYLITDAMKIVVLPLVIK